ncbi:hypothetical protein HMPREF0673_02054 [Leyella stercorea DSM 18206]|uniref:Uncharacterized protein n=1 Tax=Leyella stercorea DSM 18206 TaxID=1002367 RepID=G6AZJ0_9BACT|nr:hypothetical protein HMPREF0673_02054 [Leyella stercorea DSM 18206]
MPRYDNIVVLLRQHCCPATATLLFCYGNIVVLLRQHRCPAVNVESNCSMPR